ncbi:LysR family transcriptional regulator [Photobacterium indicum]|uniref:LysR family transcriptional regulator n=1 Tax=Photobacterium indicum TaxID=81447 RepID=A0A2T3LA45_9GAMM|nr:LysR family transcriptional regulator [Photobacterium indicum]PSV48182.1 LysR family transcriptional regulator [Photobacterium indicum]
MNIQHLKAFVLAHQLGSISAAARTMGKRQSQVSQWISELEIDFGVTLLERTGNSIRLSAAGEELLPMMVHTVSQADKLTACASALSLEEPTLLRIGIDNYIPQSCLQAVWVKALQQLNVNLEVSTNSRKALLVGLDDGSLDISLLTEHTTLHYSDFDYCRLGSYRDVLVAGISHPLASESVVTADHLSAYRELIWTREAMTDDEEVGYSPTYATFTELASLVAVLQNGVGYAMLPYDQIAPYLAANQADKRLQVLSTDFEQAAMSRRVEAVWQHGLSQTEQGKLLLSLIKTEHALLVE